MLRRSTGLSEEMNRVGVVRRMDAWECGKCRNVAAERLTSPELASSVIDGTQGLSLAMDCRSRSKGSCAMSVVAILGERA